jgi:outer membrane autotransporter protein
VTPNFFNKGGVKPGTQSFTIFTGAGGATDAGLTLNAQSRAVVTYSLTVPTANDIVFGYTVDFKPKGLPPQYQTIGSAINAIQTAGVPGFLPIAAALFDVPDLNGLKSFYDAIGGGGTATTQQTAISAGAMFNALFVDQTASWLSGIYNGGNSFFLDQPALGYAARAKKSAAASHPAFNDIRAQAPDSFVDRWRMWYAPFGSHRIDAADPATGSPSATIANFGVGFGIEHQVGNALYGFAVGGSESSFYVPERATNGSLFGAHIGAYGAMRFGAFYVSGSAGYGHFDNSTTRHITVPGLMPEVATGHFDSNQAFGRIEVGRRQVFGNFAVTPFAALQFVQLWQPGYTESSGINGVPGILGLTYQSKQTLSLPSFLGMQFDARYASPQGWIFTPYLRAAWVHEFSAERSVDASFNVAPGFLFNTIGAPAATDVAQITAGGNLQLNRNVALFGNFTGDFGKNTQVYSGLGGLRVGW